jgi:hypothetical protein
VLSEDDYRVIGSSDPVQCCRIERFDRMHLVDGGRHPLVFQFTRSFKSFVYDFTAADYSHLLTLSNKPRLA